MCKIHCPGGEGVNLNYIFLTETRSVPNVLTRIVESREMCLVSKLFNLKIEFSDSKSKMEVKMAVIVITIDLVLSSGFTSVYEPVNFSMFCCFRFPIDSIVLTSLFFYITLKFNRLLHQG